MKKLILIAAVAIVSLASCGKSYMVHNCDNNRLEYVPSNEVGDHKVGDTIRTQNVHRMTDAGNIFQTTKFTGVVISVENN
jgi:ribosomal protein L19